VQRIQDFGAVQRQIRDVVRLLIQDELVAH
jgi:hypothetical protein